MHRDDAKIWPLARDYSTNRRHLTPPLLTPQTRMKCTAELQEQESLAASGLSCPTSTESHKVPQVTWVSVRYELHTLSDCSPFVLQGDALHNQDEPFINDHVAARTGTQIAQNYI